MGFLDVEIKEDAQTVWNLIKGWAYFFSHEIVVGITEETAGRSGPINNAALAYLHTNGSPAHNIPPRPFLEPALSQSEVLDNIQKLLREAAMESLVLGNADKCEELWEKAGLYAASEVKKFMSGGVPPPNAPSTVAKKGSSTPLIDTGQLMNSITYEVRRK